MPRAFTVLSDFIDWLLEVDAQADLEYLEDHDADPVPLVLDPYGPWAPDAYDVPTYAYRDPLQPF